MKPKYTNSMLRNLTSGSTLVTAISICFVSSALALDNHWTGATSTDWNTATNWDLGRVPAFPNGNPSPNDYDDAIVNITSPIATVTATPSVTSRDLAVGRDAGNTGRLDVRAGTLSTGGGNWAFSGHNGGTGTINVADTSTPTVGPLSGFAQGSGSMNVGGQFRIGYNGNSNGTLNINTTGTIAVASEFRVGIDNNGNTGVVNLDSGTVNTGGWTIFGNAGSNSGTLNVNGGQFNKGGNDHLILGDNGGTGTINLNGGTVSVNNESWIGQATGTGFVNIHGGTFNSNSWVGIGRANNASHGTVTQDAGTWNKTGGGNFVIADGGVGVYNLSGTGAVNINGEVWVGQSGGSNGTLNMSGGTVTNNSWVAIGRGGQGTVNMTGGTWTKTGDSQFIVGSSGPGVMNMSGGLVDVQQGYTWVGEGGGATTAALNISGTAEFRTSIMSVGPEGPSATLNLDGGTLKVTRFSGNRERDAFQSSGTGTINFNGTQIVVTGTSTEFIKQVDNLNVASGGLKVDSAGFSPLTNQALSGVGGVVKSGLGTLTLAGLNTYSGANTVNGGKLVVNGDSTGTGALTVANGAGFGVVQNTDTLSFTAASATFGTASGATTLDINLGNLPGNPTASPLNVTGALTLNGPVTINIADLSPFVGPVPLVHYTGTKLGSGNFVLGTLPNGVVATLNDNGVGQVTLNVTSVSLPLWNGTVNGVWDKVTATPGSGTQNWIDQVSNSASKYADPAPVKFNDSALISSLTLNIAVAPSAVVFDNSFLAYTLNGSGKITGSTGLTKSGTLTLAVGTANDYTGVTRIEGGTLSVGTLTNGGVASPIGAASSAPANLVLAGGILDYSGSAVTIDRGVSVAGADNTVISGLNLAGDVTTSGQITTTFGKLVKSGPGTLTLTNTGTNVLANGSAGDNIPQAFQVVNGGVVLNGAGQIDTITGWAAVGTAAGSSSFSVLNGAALTVNGRAAFSVADSSNTTVTISGTSSVQTKDTTVFGVGASSITNVVIKDSGSLNKTGGWLSVGSNNSSTAVLTVQNSGHIGADGDFNIGDVDSSNGTVNLLDNATVTSTGNTYVGKNTTTGTLNVAGASVMTTGEISVGGGGGSHGTLDIKGTASFTSGGRLQVGQNGGSSGNVVIENSGVMTVNSYVSVGFGGGGTMTVKDSGTFTNTDDFSVNENGDVPAFVTVQDNGSLSAARTIFVGRGTGKVGTLTVAGHGTVTQSGTGYSFLVGPAGTGTLNVGNTVADTGNVIIASTNGLTVSGGGGNGTVNLNGGTITTVKVSDGGGTSNFTFNGGVLKAGTGAALDFLSGLDSVSVGGVGVGVGRDAFIDSNGQTIAINQALGDGGGNLIKQGAGTLQLNGANAFLGTTTVAAGILGGTGSISGELVVPSGSSIAPGASGVGTFTVGDTLATGSTLAGTYVCEVSGATADNLAVAGSLNITGSTLNVSVLAAPTASSLVIASYDTLTGTFATITGLPSGYSVDYNYLGGKQIALVQSGSPYNTWASSFGLNPLTDGAPGFDKDGDGQINAVEFALGGSPISGSNNAKVFGLAADSDADGDTTKEQLITIAVRSGTPAFTGSPSPTAVMDGITYTVEGSTTLTSFPVVVTPVSVVVPPAPNASAPAGYEFRTFSLTGSNGLPTKGFLRVKIAD